MIIGSWSGTRSWGFNIYRGLAIKLNHRIGNIDLETDLFYTIVFLVTETKLGRKLCTRCSV